MLEFSLLIQEQEDLLFLIYCDYHGCCLYIVYVYSVCIVCVSLC